jgi:hypothetical protein
VAPNLLYRWRRHSEAFCENRPRVIAGLHSRPNLRRPLSADCYAIAFRAVVSRLRVKMNRHGGTPARTPLRTDLAMNRADRRRLM